MPGEIARDDFFHHRALVATVMSCLQGCPNNFQDCDWLHAGVDEMRKNTNPFTGGINFDASWLHIINTQDFADEEAFKYMKTHETVLFI